jgi:ABC-type multidrug transport system ATPase subunit
VRTDGVRIPFANEASGYKKLGFLGLLVTSGQLEKGSILLWDEPENSLNPELVPVLVNILLELSCNGVQIFIATHDYNLVRYFDVRKDKTVPVVYHNLTKAGEQIVCNSSSEYIKLPDNLLEKASANLFKAVVSDAMGVQDNE